MLLAIKLGMASTLAARVAMSVEVLVLPDPLSGVIGGVWCRVDLIDSRHSVARLYPLAESLYWECVQASISCERCDSTSPGAGASWVLRKAATVVAVVLFSSEADWLVVPRAGRGGDEGVIESSGHCEGLVSGVASAVSYSVEALKRSVTDREEYRPRQGLLAIIELSRGCWLYGNATFKL
jgi:hypothetical protein